MPAIYETLPPETDIISFWCLVDEEGEVTREFLRSSLALSALSALPAYSEATPVVAEPNDREYWVQVLNRVANPVLKSLSERQLKVEMPVEAPHGNVEERRQFTYLEAMGRLITGIAPWLESGPQNGPEGGLRSQYAEWSRMAIEAARFHEFQSR